MRRIHRYISPLGFIEYLTSFSYRTLFEGWIAMIFLFAAAYLGSTYIPGGEHGIHGIEKFSLIRQITDSIYFSAITSTTVGYGDLTPIGIAKLFAAIQGFLGFFGVGLLTAKIVSHKQDIVLNHMQKVSFDSFFRDMKEDLFIVRRDFDAIMKEARKGAISEKSLQNVSTGCSTCEMLIEEIPLFYTVEQELYTIDAKREMLLLDALQRTISQLEKLVGLMTKNAMTGEPLEQLRILVKTIEDTLVTWNEKSPYGQEAAFEALKNECGKLKEMLGK